MTGDDDDDEKVYAAAAAGWYNRDETGRRQVNIEYTWCRFHL